MNYATFSSNLTNVNVARVGVLNGYKVTSVLHGGRKIDLSKNSYYYIPVNRQLVSYRGTRAKVMAISADGKFNFQEKLSPRGVIPFKVSAADLHAAAFAYFLL